MNQGVSKAHDEIYNQNACTEHSHEDWDNTAAESMALMACLLVPQ